MNYSPTDVRYPKNLLPLSLDRSSRLVQLALDNYPQLAADTILNKKIRGKLDRVVGDAIRQLNFEFKRNPKIRERAYEVLIEIVFNLLGQESKKIGFLKEEIEATLKNIVYTLKNWENIERAEGGTAASAQVAVQTIIQDMKQVRMGLSMVAGMAGEIEKEIEENNLMESFVSAIKKIVKENVYYQIVNQEISKHGNDSATGLRRVRHLGYVQVSCNPVIAARAYEDFPSLWNEFKEVIKSHPEWYDNPEKVGDEIAMHGTISSIMSSWVIFRPLFLSSNFHDGLVSYQLNPYPEIAESVDGSLKDAMKIYSIIQEFFRRYDANLGNGDLEEWGRPNIVFKVAGCAPAAIDITKAFTSMGIGTNNTVTYTVSQEVKLIPAEMEGMAEARKMGIAITQVYETNMIGRLEDHLREIEAEELLREGLQKTEKKGEFIKELVEEMGVSKYVKETDSLDRKISIICSRKLLDYNNIKGPLQTLVDERFVKALKKLWGENIETDLSRLEEDIHYSGLYVTKRVYTIFFSGENKPKWIEYIQKKFGVSKEDAEEIIDKIDLLPSSKRRDNNTYFVLGKRGQKNLTNTEFPDHQVKVWTRSHQKGFNLSEFVDSIEKEPDPQVLGRLMKIPDFRKAYELTPELVQLLKEVGIKGEFGEGGIKPEDWSTFGPVAKTMKEFKNAYSTFKQKCIEFVSKVVQEANA